MRYSKEDRLDIGRRIYSRELSCSQAANEYGVSNSTAKNYLKLYCETYSLPSSVQTRSLTTKTRQEAHPKGLGEYTNMSKEELIEELVKARIKEVRLKKGYEVKGDGSVILYDNKNTK